MGGQSSAKKLPLHAVVFLLALMLLSLFYILPAQWMLVRRVKARWRLPSTLTDETSPTKPMPLAQESTRCLLSDIRPSHTRLSSLTMGIMCQVGGFGVCVCVCVFCVCMCVCVMSCCFVLCVCVCVCVMHPGVHWLVSEFGMCVCVCVCVCVVCVMHVGVHGLVSGFGMFV